MKTVFNIIKDYDNVYKDNDKKAIYIISNEDYIKSRIIINEVKAGETNYPVNIVLKNRKFDKGYLDLNQLEDFVRIKEFNPYEVIESELNIKLPVHFDINLIKDLKVLQNLDKVKLQYNPDYTFEENILLYSLDLKDFKDFISINDLLLFMDKKKEQINRIIKNSLLKVTFTSVIEEKTMDKNLKIRVLQWLYKRKDVNLLLFNIVASKILLRYRIFDKNTLGFTNLFTEEDIRHIDHDTIEKLIYNNIEYIDKIDEKFKSKFNQLFIFQESINLEYYLNNISGYIPFELTYLLTRIKENIKQNIQSNKFDNIYSLLNKAKKTFFPLSNNDNPQWEYLNDLISFLDKYNELIKLLRNYNDIEEWFDFYKNKYIRLFNSLDHSQNIYTLVFKMKFDKELEEYLINHIKIIEYNINNNYESFLYNNYNKFLRINKNMTISGKLREINEIIKNNKVILIVIDAMRYEMWNVIRDIFESNDYSVTNKNDVTLAMLPSVTDISRRAFFAGNKYSNLINQKMNGNYAFNINDEYSHIKRYYETKKIAFNKGGKSNFNKLMQEEADMYVFVYTDVDELFHGLIDIDKDIIHTVFKVQVNNFVEQIENKLAFDSYKIVLTTDHGSIDTSDKIDIKLSKDIIIYLEDKKIKLEQHGKYYKLSCDKLVSDDVYNELVSHFKKKGQWHVIDRDKMSLYGLPKEDLWGHNLLWIMAKYQYYIKGLKGSNVHGGLSMKETIIPFVTLEKNIDSLKPLKIEFNDDLQLNEISNIEIIVINPNNFNIKHIKIISRQLYFNVNIDTIKPFEKLKLIVKLTPEQGGNIDSNIEVKYEFKGNETIDKYKISFSVKEKAKDRISKNVNKSRSLDF